MATTTSALTPATLLNPQLEAQSIHLAGLSGGTLSYFDEQRRLTQAPVEGFVRLTLNDESAAAEASTGMDAEVNSADGVGWIELTDGQRMVGRWAGASRDGEAILWTHPKLGRFTLGLDDVHRVVLSGAAEKLGAVPGSVPGGTPAGDTVVLGNGDALVGFVVAVAAEAVTILPDGAADEVELAMSTVASITLANPLASPSDSATAGDLVALDDGSRVRGSGVTIQRETLRFTPTLTDAMQPVELDLAEVRRIDFAAAGLRLVELGEQPMQTVAGGSAFGLELWPRVDDAGIRLHAPITVVFELPEGTQRMAATAVLDLPGSLPAERAAWADLKLSVEADQSTADAASATQTPLHLRAQEPRGELNLSLDGAATLRLEVDPAANGPILDRLLLRDAVLLIQVPDAKPGSGDADP